MRISQIYSDKKLLLVFVFLASLVVSSLFLIFFRYVGPSQHAEPGTDFRSFYRPTAENILQGKGFWPEGMPPKYPPGYPLLLSGIFTLADLIRVNELGLITVFNVIMAALAACFLFLIGQELFNKRIALIASFLWLSYPLWLWFFKNPNTEVPFILLLYAAIWLYLKALFNRRLGLVFVAGIVFGLASLIRPISFLLPFLLAVLIFALVREGSKRLRLSLALILLAGSLIAILPWEIYVFSKIGQVVPLSVNGPLSVVDGLTFAVKEGDGGNQAAVPQGVMALMRRTKSGNLNTWSQVLQFGVKELVSEPLAFLQLMALKLARSWYATSQMWWEGKILLVQLIYLIPGLAGIIYLFKKCKDKVPAVLFLSALILYFWLMTVSALSILRYMVPAMGLFLIFSAVTIDLLWKRAFRS